MEYPEAIKHLKENYPEQFSTDGFQDGAIELLLNHFYHGLQHLVVNKEALQDTMHDLCYTLTHKLEFFSMCYAAEGYIAGINEVEDE